jgi:hypothetical protein
MCPDGDEILILSIPMWISNKLFGAPKSLLTFPLSEFRARKIVCLGILFPYTVFFVPWIVFDLW